MMIEKVYHIHTKETFLFFFFLFPNNHNVNYFEDIFKKQFQIVRHLQWTVFPQEVSYVCGHG